MRQPLNSIDPMTTAFIEVLLSSLVIACNYGNSPWQNSGLHNTVAMCMYSQGRSHQIWLVVRAQERYTLGGPGGMLLQENFEI